MIFLTFYVPLSDWFFTVGAIFSHSLFLLWKIDEERPHLIHLVLKIIIIMMV